MAPTPTPKPTPAAIPPGIGQFATQVYTDNKGNSITFYLYSPANYNPAAKYPLVLVLHGVGERFNPTVAASQNAANLLRQKYLAPLVSQNVQSQWPCFVLVPQVYGSNSWVNVPGDISTYTLAPQPALSLQLAMDTLRKLQSTYSTIDRRRIYVEGISMGGTGTWDAIERWPSVFAAAIPIAGEGDPSHASAIASVPIWTFQGLADTPARIAGTHAMVQAIQAAGGAPLYTTYPGMGHDVWNTEGIMSNQQVLSWLFSQSLPSPTAEHSCPPDMRPCVSR